MDFSNTKNTTLKISIASHTRFHMFDLATQMIRLKQDLLLYTGYPKWKLIPEIKAIAYTHPSLVLTGYALQRLGYRDRKTKIADAVLRDFGGWVARKLDKCNVFDALSGCGLEGGQRVQREGGLWLCNCGSTHILFQKAILEEEHARWSAPSPFFSTCGLDRVLAEYHGADNIIVPSEFVRRTFIDLGIPTDKVVKIPYGVDLSTFRPRPKNDQKFRVLFVGRFSIRKGVGYLLDGLRPLVDAKHIELWLIGSRDPSAEHLLAKHANAFIDKGSYPRAQLSEIYSQGSVLVLPSVDDGFGLVQAQAMACGLPVIATTNSGAEDLFTDGLEGFIVPIRDTQVIKERVEYLLGDPGRQKEMGSAALERVKRLGGWNKYGEEALATYRWLLQKQHASEVGHAKQVFTSYNCDPHIQPSRFYS